MKKLLLSLFVLLALGTINNNAFAQGEKVIKVNSVTDAPQAKTAESTESEVYFELNRQAFEDAGLEKGVLLEFEDMDGSPALFRLSSVTSYMPGTTSIVANSISDPHNQIIATYSDGRLNGLWHPTDRSVIKLGFDEELKKGKYSTHNEGHSAELFCGTDHIEMDTPADLDQRRRVQAKAAESASFSSAPVFAGAEDDSITIDLMIVYTNTAETYANDTSGFGNIETLIAQSMNLSQTALNNSDLEIQLRLVNTTKVAYDEMEESDSGTHLRRFTQNQFNPMFAGEFNGYMEEVHTIRDQVGADVAAFFIWTNDTGGLGWRLGDTRGFPQLAFNLNRVQQVAEGYTLIHEIGHNMGNAHSRTQVSQRAEITGGLFHYSVGFRSFQGFFATVMGYAEGYDRAPLFSSPDLTWQGEAAGTNSASTPEDNALSMAQIKRVIAGYRPSLTEAPDGNVSTNQLDVELNLDETANIQVQIANTGLSPLVWSADFDIPQALKRKGKSSPDDNRQTFEPAIEPENKRAPLSYSPYRQDNQKAKSMQEETLYSTSFESSDNFIVGSYEAVNSWRSTTAGNLDISDSNPKTGSQHLRVAFDGTQNTSGDAITKFVSAPFFGYQQLGSYEVSLSFNITSVNEIHDFYLFDGNNGSFTAGLIIADQTIYYADLDEVNSVRFFSSNNPITVLPGTWYDLKIEIDPETAETRYFINGNLQTTNSLLNGRTPGQLEVLNRNAVSGSAIDVDDLVVKKVAAPYNWLNVPVSTGVAFEGSSSTMNLNFTSQDVPAGDYETDLVISTNDPDNSTIRIPVSLTINNIVSNETNERPDKIRLSQNYPNPFNPSTTISYTLEQASEILLEVYAIDGRKVATLEQGVKQQGQHQVTFDASNLSSGIYMYRLTTPNHTITRQMVLVK